MNNVPNGWTWTTLGKVCSKPQYGWTSKASKTGVLKYLRTSDISGGKIHWETVPYCQEMPPEPEKYKIKKNDILVSRAGSVGISCRIENVPTNTVFASYLIRFKPLDDTEPKYIEYFLKSDQYWRSISDFTAGIAIPNVNATKLSSLEIPLAPPNEQRRIVAKLEKLLTKVEACLERLDKIPTILKRFRQSVLAAACSGRLTHDLTYAAEMDPRQEITLRDITAEIRTGPFGSALHKSDYISSGVPVVNPLNMVNGRIQPLSNMTVSESTKNRLHKYLLLEGDIVIARRGKMGRCAVVTSKEAGWLCGTGSAILRLKPTALPCYIQLVISSPEVRAYLSDISVGTTMENLNQSHLSEIPVLLPSLTEQQEIVHHVESLFKITDQIEERYKKAKTYIDKLTQSILAKAFRGELVSQDPNDEQTTKLLGCMKEECVKTQKAIQKHQNKKEGN